MLCFKAQKEQSAQIHIIICLVLAVLSVIFCFTPLVKVRLADEEIINNINSVIEENIPGEDIGELPKEIQISAIKMYRVVGLLINEIKAISQNENTEDGNGGQSEGSDMYELLFDENGNIQESVKDTVLIVLALVSPITSMGEVDSDSLLGPMLGMLIAIACLFVAVIFVMIAPIYFIILLIYMIIRYVISIKNPERVATKIGGILPKGLIFTVPMFILPCVVPTLSYSIGSSMLIIFAIICTLVNVVFTRMHEWNKKQLDFANVIQGISLVSILGFVVFFFSICNTRVFTTFINGPWSDYYARVLLVKEANGKVASSSYIVDMILIIIASMLVLSCARYLIKLVKRVSLSPTKIFKSSSSQQILYATVLLISTILPLLVAGFHHMYEDISDIHSPATSFLVLSSSQKTALIFALIGALIMFVSEILIVVLPKKLCKDITDEEAALVLSGKAFVEDEPLVEKVVNTSEKSDKIEDIESSNEKE